MSVAVAPAWRGRCPSLPELSFGRRDWVLSAPESNRVVGGGQVGAERKDAEEARGVLAPGVA